MIRAMRSSMPVGLLVALSLVGCGANTATTATSQGARSEGPPSGVSNDNVPPSLVVSGGSGPASTGPDAHSATGEILVPGPGFSPTPIRATGVAGGPVEGGSSPSGCTGSFPSTPQHVLKISRRLPQLRVMVDGVDRDLTLAIHLPNGQWLCNDDSGDPMFGLNPAIDMPDVGPGEFEVFVGTFSSSEEGRPPYTIGVTEDLSRGGSSMRDGQAPPGPRAVPSPVPSPVMPF
jgi:hypothetical protein